MDKGLDKAEQPPKRPKCALILWLRCRHGRSEAPMCVPLSHRHQPTELMFYWAEDLKASVTLFFDGEPSWLESGCYISHASVPQHRRLTYEMGVGSQLNGADQNWNDPHVPICHGTMWKLLCGQGPAIKCKWIFGEKGSHPKLILCRVCLQLKHLMKGF